MNSWKLHTLATCSIFTSFSVIVSTPACSVHGGLDRDLFLLGRQRRGEHVEKGHRQRPQAQLLERQLVHVRAPGRTAHRVTARAIDYSTCAPSRAGAAR
eukprot:2576975-Prymnesium_polylepis.1